MKAGEKGGWDPMRLQQNMRASSNTFLCIVHQYSAKIAFHSQGIDKNTVYLNSFVWCVQLKLLIEYNISS